MCPCPLPTGHFPRQEAHLCSLPLKRPALQQGQLQPFCWPCLLSLGLAVSGGPLSLQSHRPGIGKPCRVSESKPLPGSGNLPAGASAGRAPLRLLGKEVGLCQQPCSQEPGAERRGEAQVPDRGSRGGLMLPSPFPGREEQLAKCCWASLSWALDSCSNAATCWWLACLPLFFFLSSWDSCLFA